MEDLVPGAGWISDESSLYGDNETQERPEEKCTDNVKPCSLLGNEQDATVDVPTKPRSQAENSHRRSSTPKDGLSDKNERTHENGPSHLAAHDHDIIMQDAESARWSPSKRSTETVEEFLLRLPVSDPRSARAGPWLWVHKPGTGTGEEDHGQDIGELMNRSQHILSEHRQEREKIEGQEFRPRAKPSKKSQLTLLRDQLVEDLLEVATETGMTVGKWMLFPDPTELPRYWQLVVESTSAGRLGPTAKVGTFDGMMSDQTLICVYTPDFSDIAEVTRVLCVLVELGLCNPRGKPIYYKCDMYTYLDIGSGNEYGLRASLFSSKEILDLKTTGKSTNKVIQWIQKRENVQTSHTKDEFLF